MRGDAYVLPVILAILFGVGLIPVAILVSQHAPLVGGFLASIGEPWSPARRSGINAHVAIFAMIGMATGVSTGIVWRRSKPAAILIVAGVGLMLFLAFLVSAAGAAGPIRPPGF